MFFQSHKVFLTALRISIGNWMDVRNFANVLLLVVPMTS